MKEDVNIIRDWIYSFLFYYESVDITGFTDLLSEESLTIDELKEHLTDDDYVHNFFQKYFAENQDIMLEEVYDYEKGRLLTYYKLEDNFLLVEKNKVSTKYKIINEDVYLNTLKIYEGNRDN